jgi:hypothetical protein
VAFYDTTWYVSSVAYAAVTVRPQNTAVAAGVVRRQFTAPAVNSERSFVCIVAGTTANVTDATWSLTRGAKTTDGTVTWQEVTGMSAVNGDATNTPTWASASPRTPSLGVIIKRNSGASYQICTSAGTMQASEPAFSDTAGVTTNDGTVIWTSLGPVGNFPAWGAPHARLANAYATNWGAVGNKFYLADNHAETQATAIALSPTLTATAGAYTICVDRTVALPPVEANYNTGATVTTTGNSNITFGFNGAAGNMYFQGITFSAGTGSGGAALAMTANTCFLSYKNCSFVLPNTHASNSFVSLGSASGASPNGVLWDNCTVQFAGGASGYIKPGTGNFEWRNTPSAVQGTPPTLLFWHNAGPNATYAVCRGVDLSAVSGTLVHSGFSNTSTAPIVFEDCKFNASVTRYSTPTTYAAAPMITVRCDSGATNYKATRDEYSGSQISETSITRVGGATDGTTPQSTKIVTNAQAAFLTPYRMLRLAQWNDVTGANRTVTVCGTINAGSLPLNDEIWMDVQYLGNSGSPIASFKTTCKSHPLAAGVAVASDGSTWNNLLSGFDPSTTVNATLSNGNLTATHSSTASNSGARGLNAIGSGKYYFEAKVVVLSSDAIGVCTSSATYNNVLTGTNAICYFVSSGNMNGFGSFLGNIGAALANDVIGLAIDFTTGLIWIRKNAGNWNGSGTANPATGIGGFSFAAGTAMMPVVGFGTTGSESYTLNLGATSYANAAPSGFGNWVSYVPFKLVATLTSPQPQMKGYVYVSVRAAKASTTYYIDPQITLS